MNTSKLKRYLPRILLVLFFLGISIFFLFSSPERLLASIGIENAYLLIFSLALLGGLTTFSGVPYHLILIALAAGGLHPLLLGVCAGVGVMLGDTTTYYLGHQGSAIIPQWMQRFLRRISMLVESHPRLSPFLFFLYGSIVPFSNDFIVISMGLSRYPFWKVILPLGLGNLVFNISLAYLSVYAYGFIQTIF